MRTPCTLSLEYVTQFHNQDQAAALQPGFTRMSSAATLPIDVSVTQIALKAEMRALLQSRLLLLYTGVPRLARDLLQEVLRRWHTRDAPMLANVDKLHSIAEDMQVNFSLLFPCATPHFRLYHPILFFQFEPGKSLTHFPPFVQAIFIICHTPLLPIYHGFFFSGGA